MNKRIKNMLFIIIITSLILGLVCRINYLVYFFIVTAYTAMFINEFLDARTNFLKCLKYLIFSAPFFSLVILALISSSGTIDSMSVSNNSYLFSSKGAFEYLLLESFYFLFWLIMIVFGDVKIVKMATLVVVQIMTVLFVILNIIIYFQPISFFTDIADFSTEDIKLLLDVYGYDMRKLFELTLQLLFAPILIVAILSNLFSEIKSNYRKVNKNFKPI